MPATAVLIIAVQVGEHVAGNLTAPEVYWYPEYRMVALPCDGGEFSGVRAAAGQHGALRAPEAAAGSAPVPVTATPVEGTDGNALHANATPPELRPSREARFRLHAAVKG